MANMIIFSVLVENSRYLEYEGLIIDDLKLNNLTTRVIILIGTIGTDSTCSCTIYSALYGTKVIIKGSFKVQKKYPSSLPPKNVIGARQGYSKLFSFFNFMHHLLQQSPEDIGTRVGDQIINNIAFACSPRLKTVAQATTYLHQCGLEINPVKSHTIGIMV
ncbi:reverse transcriptase [Vespula maculifrons]|uniref:Reverse transcriptase n=1 Tax=Vespula maculifrons TaxID=7453 RepID=A0ABD2ASI0_VESMC